MEDRLIYLIRHGETEAIDGCKRFIGQLDLPLSKQGIIQAKHLGLKLYDFAVEGIYCSDLKRAMSTAILIGEQRQIRPIQCEGLREISLGEWEGMEFEEVCRKYPDEFAKRGEDIVHYSPPGGESFAVFSERVLMAFTNIVSAISGNVLIVSHAGVNRVILCHILGMPIKNLFKLEQTYCCCNIICQGDNGFRIRSLNT